MNAQKKILIVDDEEMNLDFFDLMLSKLGFIVEKARDGLEAIDKVKRFLPDLVLLDNVMPRMSGWEFTKIIKGDEQFKSIPIIMFSALDDIKDKLEGFELGVEDYITKPFNFSEVLARIRVVLRHRELFSQIEVRESRLNLAEELSVDIKQILLNFDKTVDDLDNIVEKTERNSIIFEKTKNLKLQINDLNEKLDQTIAKWEDLKKTEIGLITLETNYRKSISEEQ